MKFIYTASVLSGSCVPCLFPLLFALRIDLASSVRHHRFHLQVNVWETR